MFNDGSIASTAISSFNNAALFGAQFFAIALLSLPIFYVLFSYSRKILSDFKLDGRNTHEKIVFWSVALLALWMLIFGGNYAVMRDGISLLPLMLSCILFFLTIFIVNQAKAFNYLDKIKNKKMRWGVIVVSVILALISAVPNLYGMLLQASAIVCGIIIGLRTRKNFSGALVSTIMFCWMTVLILMQPEYFRFGQLGNLTLIHLCALLLTAALAVTSLVVKYTNARSYIRESAYIKLKWLLRILSFLALVLFFATESVPVFLGLLVALGISEMLTVYHSKKKNEVISKQSWAMMLIGFGVIIMCPVISGLGILYLSSLQDKVNLKDFRGLL